MNTIVLLVLSLALFICFEYWQYLRLERDYEFSLLRFIQELLFDTLYAILLVVVIVSLYLLFAGKNIGELIDTLKDFKGVFIR